MKTKEVVCEIRLHRDPAAPLSIRFDLATRAGIGGPVLRLVRDVGPKLLQRAIYSILADRDNKLHKGARLVGILGDE